MNLPTWSWLCAIIFCVVPSFSGLSQTNVLDFSLSEETVITNLRESLIRYGFAQIKNIPNGLIEDIQDIIDSQVIDFFDESTDNKLQLAGNKPWQFGYIPLNFESTNGIYDSRETFAIGTYPQQRKELGLDKQDAVNVWPQQLPQFKLESESLLQKMDEFSILITELFCATLNKDKHCLHKLFEENSAELRFTKYLSINESNQAIQGVGEHTDSGFMAFIFQTCSGLEFYDSINNEWIEVDYHNDTLIVNTGDMAKLLSNGLYFTPKHRVLLQNDVRYTILYFFNPNYNEPIQPLTETDYAKYQTLTWKQYLNERFNSGSYSSKKDRKKFE